MRKFTINMEGNVNEVKTNFALKIAFTEEQLQKFIIQEALLEAEHKGFENISVTGVEENEPELTQMGLFSDDQIEQDVTPNDTAEPKTNENYTTYSSIAEDTEEDTEDTEANPKEDCCEEDSDEVEHSESDYTPYAGSSPKAQSTATYSAYAATLSPKAPKSYHLKLRNDYAPYRSFRVNISTIDDIS